MLEKLLKKLGSNMLENELLGKHTNFKIGGPAEYFFEAKSSEEIIKAVKAANELNLPFFILGGGSNILVSDDGFDGLVIKAANRILAIKDRKVFADSGVLASFLARKTAEAGLSGLEWAISLPGTVGGGVRGNAGCFGGEIKNTINSVKVFDSQTTKRCTLNAKRCTFGYRDSIFKHLEPAPIILSAEFILKKDKPEACLAKLEENLKLRKEKQPLELSSAGCVFKNFEFGDRNEIFKLEKAADVPPEFINSKKIPAGWIIERLNLKGKQIGQAKISERHGNFILNLGGATASEILQLISLVKMYARDEFGVQLIEEIQLIGF